MWILEQMWGSVQQRLSEAFSWRMYRWQLVFVFIFGVGVSLFIHFRAPHFDFLKYKSVSEQYIITPVEFSYVNQNYTKHLQQKALRGVSKIYRCDREYLFQVKRVFEKELFKEGFHSAESGDMTGEMHRVCEELMTLLQSVHITNAQTIKKMQDYHLSTEKVFAWQVGAQLQITLPEEFWNDTMRVVQNHISGSADTFLYVKKYFAREKILLKEDPIIERVLRDKIISTVAPQYSQVSMGSYIISPGEKVSSLHLAMMSAMRRAILQNQGYTSVLRFLGSLFLGVGLSFLVMTYLAKFHVQVFHSRKKLTIIALIFFFALGMSKLLEYVLVDQVESWGYIFQYPLLVPMFVVLFHLLIDANVVLFLSSMLIFLLSIGLSVSFVPFFILNFMVSCFTILTVSFTKKRKDVFFLFKKVALSAVPLIFIIHGLGLSTPTVSLWSDLWIALSFLVISAFFLVGVLPLLESVFGVVTDLMLMEYMDPGNDLLRRLSVEAPGTYQHCLVVATLAESAANAIRANGLFCRVATLYHDIGKLFNPHYFSENQLGGFDIHQLLTPLESAQVIIAHVSEGELLAKKHQLPTTFIDVIREHHGSTLVYYFYHKQLEMVGFDEKKVNKELFQYPGPLPKSKESAIIMLADSVEAASRSLDEVNELALERLIEKLVQGKVEDGQLDACQLTFEEVGLVKKAFLKTLSVTGHTRVKYPERTTEKPQEAF